MVGDKIRTLRKKKGYSQEQMARKLNVTQGAVSQWETGNTAPNSNQLGLIADLFGISVDELMERTTTQEPPDQKKLDNALVKMLMNLSPEEVQRVQDFVSGMKAKRKA